MRGKAAALAALLALGAPMVFSASAGAAERYLTVVPAAGDLDTPIDLHLPTGAFCPSDAHRVIVRMTGGNLEAPFNLTGNTDIVALDALSRPGTTIIPLIWTWRDAEGNVEPEPVEFDGRYRITLSCLKGLSLETLGDTVADVVIDRAKGTYRVTSPQPPGRSDVELQSGQDSGEAAKAQGNDNGNGSGAGSDGSGGSVPEPDSEPGVAEGSSADSSGAAPDQSTGTSNAVPGAGPDTAESLTDQGGVGDGSLQAQPAAATDTSGSGVQSMLFIGGGALLAGAALVAWRARRTDAPS